MCLTTHVISTFRYSIPFVGLFFCYVSSLLAFKLFWIFLQPSLSMTVEKVQKAEIKWTGLVNFSSSGTIKSTGMTVQF